jgi:hypothetical protein
MNYEIATSFRGRTRNDIFAHMCAVYFRPVFARLMQAAEAISVGTKGLPRTFQVLARTTGGTSRNNEKKLNQTVGKPGEIEKNLDRVCSDIL